MSSSQGVTSIAEFCEHGRLHGLRALSPAWFAVISKHDLTAVACSHLPHEVTPREDELVCTARSIYLPLLSECGFAWWLLEGASGAADSELSSAEDGRYVQLSNTLSQELCCEDERKCHTISDVLLLLLCALAPFPALVPSLGVFFRSKCNPCCSNK
jgi:hypothetical protein